MNVEKLLDLSAQWRNEAKRLAALGLEPAASMSETHAQELEERVREWLFEELPIAEAAQEAGYTKERLRELVRRGALPDSRSSGQGRIFIRRCDLPRKPQVHRSDELDEFIKKVLTSRT